MRLAVAANCILLIASIALDPVIARADDSPCAPIAQAVEANTLREFLETPDAETLIYDLFDDDELGQQTTIGMDWDQRHALVMDAVRRQLAASDPVVPEAMAEAVFNIVQNGRTWLLRADINNDGSDDWWLKTAGGRFYCETNWFYDGGPPYPFMGRIGSAGMEEHECGYQLNAIRIGNTNYLTKEGDAAVRVLAWRGTNDFNEICSVTWGPTGKFNTTTTCLSADQKVCDAVAQEAQRLTAEPAYDGSENMIGDLAALGVETQSSDYRPDYVRTEFADIDNDGDDDIIAIRPIYENWWQTSYKTELFRRLDDQYRELSGDMITWWAQRSDGVPSYESDIPDFNSGLTYAMVVDQTTYLVQREREFRAAWRFRLRIFEIVGESARFVGTVAADPIPYVAIHQRD